MTLATVPESNVQFCVPGVNAALFAKKTAMIVSFLEPEPRVKLVAPRQQVVARRATRMLERTLRAERHTAVCAGGRALRVSVEEHGVADIACFGPA
jgi:hypothetical protein